MTISTHVLDTSIGRPAAAISVQLERQDGAGWIRVSAGVTDHDGRVAALLPPDAPRGAGRYRLTFDVGKYFEARGVESFYSTIAIDFLVRDEASHYHVPLLLSPYGFSTYRGVEARSMADVSLRNPSPQSGKAPRQRLVGGRAGSHGARWISLTPSPCPDLWRCRGVFPSDAAHGLLRRDFSAKHRPARAAPGTHATIHWDAAPASC
jgi:5-hydroxyisourate hydrolase